MLSHATPPETTSAPATEPPTSGTVDGALSRVWVSDERYCVNVAPEECRRMFRDFPRLVRVSGGAEPRRDSS